MYVTDFVCTYRQQDDDVKEDIYRVQFIQAFGLDRWDDESIEKGTMELFDTVKELPEMDILFEKLGQSSHGQFFKIVLGDSDDTLFRVLFNFHLFDFAHRCFCDLLRTGRMQPENRDNLFNNL
jgi:hypothetical protein